MEGYLHRLSHTFFKVTAPIARRKGFIRHISLLLPQTGLLPQGVWWIFWGEVGSVLCRETGILISAQELSKMQQQLLTNNDCGQCLGSKALLLQIQQEYLKSLSQHTIPPSLKPHIQKIPPFAHLSLLFQFQWP